MSATWIAPIAACLAQAAIASLCVADNLRYKRQMRRRADALASDSST